MRTGRRVDIIIIRPSIPSFLYGIIYFIFYIVLVGRKEKNSKANKQTKKEGAGA